MDEAKRRELEELKKQIDPKVLERIAKAMGGGGGGGGGGSAPAPAGSQAARRPSGPAQSHSSSMHDLKARIARRERELNLPYEPPAGEESELGSQTQDESYTQPLKPKVDKAFLIYDVNVMRSRQINAYFQRMSFFNTTMVGDPKRFIEALINKLNNAAILYPAIVCHVDSLALVQAVLASDDFIMLRQQVRHMTDMALFVMFDDERDLARIRDVDPRYIMSMRHDSEFNKKRVTQVLELLHKPDPSLVEPEAKEEPSKDEDVDGDEDVDANEDVDIDVKPEESSGEETPTNE
jgi:hypothetical protein